jgi:hypothetical protein
MAKMVIHREGGQTIEISDLTLDEVKELAGLNGHSASAHPAAPSLPKKIAVRASDSDVDGFMAALTDRAKTFISILQQHPQGIEANSLAPLLGLNDPRQIGGFTGGGLAKIAKRFKIKMNDIYKSEVTFPNKKRTRMFYPGKVIKRQPLQMEKPAV